MYCIYVQRRAHEDLPSRLDYEPLGNRLFEAQRLVKRGRDKGKGDWCGGKVAVGVGHVGSWKLR